MVNDALAVGWRHAERRIILSYAPADLQDALSALLALDDTLASVLRTLREPAIAQMRMSWWHDALTRLDTAPPPAQPVLVTLSSAVVPRGVPGTSLAHMVEGWEELVGTDDLSSDALQRFATGRGALFEIFGALAGVRGPLVEAGQGWALADLAHHSRDGTVAAAMASPLLKSAANHRWERRGRALGAMVHLARMGDAGPAARTGRALWHRLTGL